MMTATCSPSPPTPLSIIVSSGPVRGTDGTGGLFALPHDADERFHVLEVALERAPAAGRQPVFRLRNAALERLRARDELGFLELARVHRQVAVGRVEQLFQLVERQLL